MTSRSDVLRRVMVETDTTQAGLSRMSGVRQPSISQYLSGAVNLSDDQLSRLLSCMGRQLEVVFRPTVPELTRSERLSWLLHRRLSAHLTQDGFPMWRARIEDNLRRLRGGVSGQPHLRHLDQWAALVERGDVAGIRRVLTGLDRECVGMREVSPMGGLLPQDERADVLRTAG